MYLMLCMWPFTDSRESKSDYRAWVATSKYLTKYAYLTNGESCHRKLLQGSYFASWHFTRLHDYRDNTGGRF